MSNLDPFIARLTDAADWLTEQIDGSDECRGRDAEIRRHIRAVEGAAALLRAYEQHVATVDRAIDGLRKEVTR